MLDIDAWECLRGICSTINQHRQRVGARHPPRDADCFGSMHLLLFGHTRTEHNIPLTRHAQPDLDTASPPDR